MSDTNQNEKGDWKDREIGALWLRKSAAGNKYLSGHVGTAENEGIEDNEKTRVIIFANKDKKNDKAPDYRIYKSEPQQNSSSASSEKSSVEQDNSSTSEDDLDVL